jgi:hypothetical protein
MTIPTSAIRDIEAAKTTAVDDAGRHADVLGRVEGAGVVEADQHPPGDGLREAGGVDFPPCLSAFRYACPERGLRCPTS